MCTGNNCILIVARSTRCGFFSLTGT